MVGFQPRMVEALSREFDIRLADMDPGNIGKTKFGCLVEAPERARENLAWCDVCVVTGSTVTNGTLSTFLAEKPGIFYGVSIAGTARLLGLERFCPYGE